MHHVTSNSLSTLLEYLPDLSEQREVATFLERIENLIAVNQRKAENLQKLKKSLLQQMFVSGNDSVPRIRFAGFADAWEQRKLSELVDHRGGTAIEKYFGESGEYKVISIGSYGLDNQYVDQNIRAVSNKITRSRLVHKGELTMVLNDKTSNGTIIGRLLLIDRDSEYVVNQRTEIISPKKLFNSNFAFVILNGPFREEVKRIVQGGTQIYVNYSAVEKLPVTLPTPAEQYKIGEFFIKVDAVIALHQRKVENLQKLKKSLLHLMFI